MQRLKEALLEDDFYKGLSLCCFSHVLLFASYDLVRRCVASTAEAKEVEQLMEDWRSSGVFPNLPSNRWRPLLKRVLELHLDSSPTLSKLWATYRDLVAVYDTYHPISSPPRAASTMTQLDAIFQVVALYCTLASGMRPTSEFSVKSTAIQYLASSFVSRVPASKQATAVSALLSAIPDEFRAPGARERLLNAGRFSSMSPCAF